MSVVGCRLSELLNARKLKQFEWINTFASLCLRTGVLAGIFESKDKFMEGEFRNWLGENGNGFIGVTPGDSNGFIPGMNEQLPNELFELFDAFNLCVAHKNI